MSYVTQFFCCINLSEGHSRSTLSMVRACRFSLYSILNVAWCGAIMLLQYDNTHLLTLHSAVAVYDWRSWGWYYCALSKVSHCDILFCLTRRLLTSTLPSADSGEMGNIMMPDARNPTNLLGHSSTRRAESVHAVTLLGIAYHLTFVPIAMY